MRKTNLEVPEEGVHKQVEDDEWGEDGVDDSHEDEAVPQSTPQHANQSPILLNSFRPVHSLRYRLLPIPPPNKFLPHMSPLIKQIIQQTKPQIPLQHLRQAILPETEEEPIVGIVVEDEGGGDGAGYAAGEGDPDAEVEEVFVEEGDEVVFLAQDAAADYPRQLARRRARVLDLLGHIVRIQLDLLPIWRQLIPIWILQARRRIIISNLAYPPDDFRPGYCLYVIL